MEQSSVIYKLVNNFPNYRVGSDGTVWKLLLGRKRQPTPRWKQLKTPSHMPNSPKGRPVLNLVSVDQTRHVYLGRLVLETFVGPCPEGHECCHDPDRNPMNCAISNLRWGTSKDNQQDQIKHGTQAKGERHGMSKLSDEQVANIRLLKGSQSTKSIAAQFGITQSYASQLLNNKVRL